MMMYYKLLSIVYNLLPTSSLKDRLYKYANERFPIVGENENQENNPLP